ncbi:hypothetical protein ACTMSW_20820 [Micromonospora sp. BQ11]|uniref:hypothetical protein n=1 Tax=Micromonospora sp. BQ11 TaxID=3452212 RepID=UPI003F8A852F
MDDRFRKLPPRIEPTYETEDVSNRPPTPEVRETNPWSPAGEVAGYKRFTDGVLHVPYARARTRRAATLLVVSVAVVLLAMVAVLLLLD